MNKPKCPKCKAETALFQIKETHTQYKCYRCNAVCVIMNKKRVGK
jgi:transposase-like protein